MLRCSHLCCLVHTQSGAAEREARAWIPWDFFDQVLAALELLQRHESTSKPKAAMAQDLFQKLKAELQLHATP